MNKRNKWIYNTKTHLIMYALLLIFTPFLMLRNYLQSAIGKLSRLSYIILDIEIPYLLTIFIIVLAIIILKNFRKIKHHHILGGLAAILLIYLAQLFADYYFDHRFYDLQHNWHYFAYGIYSFIAFRYFKGQDKPISKIILLIFISALALSTFDEGTQVFISGRIFDVSDIAKDAWGAIIGMIFLFVGVFPDELKQFKFQVTNVRIKDYLHNPKTLLFWELIFTFILILVSSVLADMSYWYYVVTITFVSFLLIFFLFHFSRNKYFRFISLLLIILLLILQSINFLKYRNDYIVSNKYGLVVYRGIPIPFFDVMIFPNNTFRLVDKKHSFNSRDLATIYNKVDDILLIGSGHEGLGGKGFPEDFPVQFVFNHIKNKALQIIILPTPEACNEFNRLKKEGKNVLFIIHNTC